MQIDQTGQSAPKQLQLWTSNLTHLFTGSAGHDPLKFVDKGTWPWSRDHQNFSELNVCSSETVKAIANFTWQ